MCSQVALVTSPDDLGLVGMAQKLSEEGLMWTLGSLVEILANVPVICIFSSLGY